MSREASAGALAGLLMVAVGLALLSDPQCGRGCRTVAEHILQHGLEDFFRGLEA